MALNLVTGPTIEPVTLEEAKTHCRIDLTITDEDALVADLIVAATRHVERFTHRRLISQAFDDKRDAAPSQVWESPVAPVLSIDSVSYVDGNGTTQTWSSALYRTDIPAGPTAGPARLTPIYSGVWPQTQGVINAFTVRFTAGYGTTAASVPYDIKAAIKLLIGHLYANREAGNIGNIVTPLPLGVESLLWPYKYFAC